MKQVVLVRRGPRRRRDGRYRGNGDGDADSENVGGPRSSTGPPCTWSKEDGELGWKAQTEKRARASGRESRSLHLTHVWRRVDPTRETQGTMWTSTRASTRTSTRTRLNARARPAGQTCFVRGPAKRPRREGQARVGPQTLCLLRPERARAEEKQSKPMLGRNSSATYVTHCVLIFMREERWRRRSSGGARIGNGQAAARERADKSGGGRRFSSCASSLGHPT
jgi:hypothetical protein